MIEGIELTIYTSDGNDIAFDLTPTQTEVIFKALGIQIDSKKNEITSFADNSLKEHILPKINFIERSP